jgi:iron(III) transport system substrate-binding protein
VRVALAVALLFFAACRIELGTPGEHVRAETATPSGELWIYTSLYQHVVDDLDRLAKQRLPEVEIEWFAAGSEKVAARIDGELAAGATRCDVVLTSDPFFFARMKREERLLPYVPPLGLRVPRQLVDPDGAWLTSRIATMVVVYNTKILDRDRAPQGYKDLLREDFRQKIILGDPLASGTFFTTVAFLVREYGWEYFDRLKQNGIVSTGGNSTVIDRVSSGEFSAGLVLLENVLTAKRKGAPIDYLLPEEGAVIIPGPIALFKTTHNPQAAKAFADLVFSPEGQAAFVRGDMHSPDERQPAPEGAPTFHDLIEKALPWSEALIEGVEKDAPSIRATFNERVQR